MLICEFVTPWWWYRGLWWTWLITLANGHLCLESPHTHLSPCGLFCYNIKFIWCGWGFQTYSKFPVLPFAALQNGYLGQEFQAQNPSILLSAFKSRLSENEYILQSINLIVSPCEWKRGHENDHIYWAFYSITILIFYLIQIKMPADFKLFQEMMEVEFGVRFNRLFRGPAWSGLDRKHWNYPLKVTNMLFCVILRKNEYDMWAIKCLS